MNFASNIEIVDEVTRRIKITVPQQEFASEVSKAIAKVAQSAKINGFRPGKAPKALIEKMYGESARLDVAQKLINSTLNDTAKANSFDVVGSPEVDIASFDAAKDFEFTAVTSLFPAPEVKGYRGVKVQVVRQPVTDEDVNKMVQQLLISKSTTKKIEGRTVAQTGDVVGLTIGMAVDGEDGDRPEPLVALLGEGKLPEDLENAIVGMEIGTTKTVESSRGTGEAAKRIVYTVTLNDISERIPPAEDDDFVKSLLGEPQTVLELRLKIRKDLESEREKTAKAEAETAILDELEKQHQFQVPQVLIDDEIRSMLVRYRVVDSSKAESADLEPFRKELGGVALRRVRSSIIVDRIGEAEKIKAEKEDMDQEIEALAAQSHVSVADARAYVTQRDRAVGFYMGVARQKIVRFLVEQAQIEYVEKKVESAPAA